MDRFVKIGFGALAIFALLFGFISLAQNLKLSFKEGNGAEATESDALLEEAKQKITDTDGDSLSDWDELRVYGTSPYLADSDSDGISDSEEIKSGADPNCPKGKECGSSDLPATAPVVVPEQSVGSNTGSTATSSIEDLDNLSPDEIRALLKQGGATDEQLQGATDEDLQKLLDEVINSSDGN